MLDDNRKYVTYSHNFIRKVYGIYKDEYKEKISIKTPKQANEEDTFTGCLLDGSSYTKKLGGM